MYKGHIVTAVILAAGCGKRMNAGKNKLLLEVSGKSILSYTAKCFDLSEYVDELVFVAAEGECDAVKGLVSPYVSKPFSVVNFDRNKGTNTSIFHHFAVLKKNVAKWLDNWICLW